VGQDVPVLVDAVRCVLEGQFSDAVLLIFREYGPLEQHIVGNK
jgi:hypothetical protein